MSKILLINPALETPFYPRSNFNIPVALIYLASYLYQKGHEVKILDANNYTNNSKFSSRIIKEVNSSVFVGITAMTAQVPHALDIARFLKSLDPSVPVVLGGVHPTLYPQQTTENDYIDYSVVNEGEITIPELIKVIEGKKNPKDVDNIVFKSNEKCVTTKQNCKFFDLNDLHELNWNLIDIVEDLGMKTVAKSTEISLVTSKGCPHRCSFCINVVLKNRFRYRSTENIINDIENLIALGTKKIYFVDDNFFANKKRLEEIIRNVEERGMDFEWFGNIRADYFNENFISYKVLKKVKKIGCKRLGMGIESGSQKILNKIKKDITIKEIIKSSDMLNKVGITPNFSFMIGLPGETFEDVKKTVRLICKLKKIAPLSSFIGPQLYRPYPGSKLFFECLDYGFKEPESFQDWAIQSEKMRKEEIRNYEYPWLNVPIEIINNIVFYINLGFNELPSEYNKEPFRTLQKIARLRCEKENFGLPIEKKLFDLKKKIEDAIFL